MHIPVQLKMLQVGDRFLNYIDIIICRIGVQKRIKTHFIEDRTGSYVYLYNQKSDHAIVSVLFCE